MKRLVTLSLSALSLSSFSLSSFSLVLIFFLCSPVGAAGNCYAQCLWSPDTLLSDVDGEFSNEPDMASKGNYIHLVWQDYKDIAGQVPTSRIWYRRSNNNGASWGNMKVITPKSSPGDFHEPRIAVSGKNIHVVFIGIEIAGGDMVSAIYYIQSANNGNSWSRPVRLNRTAPAPYEAWYPDISVSGETVHVYQ